MAVQHVETWTDDLDGNPAVDTIAFAVGNEAYEIDVSPENRDRFWDFMTPWVRAARRRQKPTSSGPHLTVVVDHAKVRAFCQARGIPIASGGRPGREQVLAYVEAWAEKKLEPEFR